MMFLGADKDKWSERLFFASYILWLISAALRLSMFRYFDWFNLFYAVMQIVAFLLIAILFFLRKRNTIKDIIGIAILFFCLLLALNSRNIYIIPTVIYIYFGADFDFQKVLKCTLLVQVIIMALVIFCSQVGIVEDVIWVSEGRRIRHSLGYDYCAYPAHLLLFMSLMWLCIREKITAFDILILLTLNSVMYYFTDSRADFFLAVLGILGILIWQRDFQHHWINIVRSFVTRFGFVFMTIISILGCSYLDYEDEVYLAINDFFSKRLFFGYQAMHEYGFTLFGQPVTWIGQGRFAEDPTSTYNYVDNAYIQIGVTFGIIFMILLAIGFYITGKYLIVHKEYKLSWALLMSLAYGVLNAHLCMPAFNVFILLLGCCFKKVKEEDNQSVIQRVRSLTDKR